MAFFSFFRKKGPVIVVAPDKFKGTLTAVEVAEAVAGRLRRGFAGAEIRLCPMADGGDGTSEILGRLMGLARASAMVTGPTGVPQMAPFYADSRTAVIDTASVVGLARLAGGDLHPFESTSYGVGELVGRLVAQGHETVMVGIGGTATVDGGAGMLQALGARYFDVNGFRLPTPVTAGMLDQIYHADFTGIDRQTLKAAVVGLADVAVPLEGSLAFAAQKGVDESEMPRLRDALLNFAMAVDMALGESDEPCIHAGAGGGVGYALERVLRCPVESGAGYLLESYGMFDGHVDLVVTGEGCLDSQTAAGKVVDVVRGEAGRHGVPLVAVVGRNKLPLPVAGLEVIDASAYLGNGVLDTVSARAALGAALDARLIATCSRMLG